MLSMEIGIALFVLEVALIGSLIAIAVVAPLGSGKGYRGLVDTLGRKNANRLLGTAGLAWLGIILYAIGSLTFDLPPLFSYPLP